MSELNEQLSKALRRAYNLGQTYWQQADSESYSQNKKSYETAARFEAMVAETLAEVTPAPQAAPSEPVALLTVTKADGGRLALEYVPMSVLPPGEYELHTTPAPAQRAEGDARDAALEEAAKICEEMAPGTNNNSDMWDKGWDTALKQAAKFIRAAIAAATTSTEGR